MPAERIPNTARRTESSPPPVPTTVDLPSLSCSGPVNVLVGTDPARDSRTVHTERAGGTQTAPTVLPYFAFPTATVRPTPAPTTPVVKPPRHNFAGYCLMCGQRGCQSGECITLYAETAWAVCNMCDGEGWINSCEPCHCVHGVTQADDDWPGAVTR
jgi:hypothetical protein